tara:strand:+ start:258 stop:506 length:249 start_codon:yes stop_codon:yes gene_type:complete
MSKAKKRKLSTPKQLEIVNEEMEKLKKRLKSKDVSAPNFVFGTQYFITQFAHDTAPSCNFATMVLLGAMNSYLENDVEKQQN